MKLIQISVALATLTASYTLPPAAAELSRISLLSSYSWDILYSPGMPAHPTAVDSGWYFDFPAPHCGAAAICSVHYMGTPVRGAVAAGSHINAAFHITT